MKYYSNDKIIKGILQNDNFILQYIYNEYYPKINYFIINNNGIEEDAKDIFQEGLIIIYRKIKESQSFLKCSFETYLYSVCKLLWLKQLRKKRIRFIVQEKLPSYFKDKEYPDIIYTIEKNERHRLYQKYFLKLGKDCQKTLRLFLDEIPLKDIAKLMGYKNENYAKKKKYKCKETLINNIKHDNEFKELENNNEY